MRIFFIFFVAMLAACSGPSSQQDLIIYSGRSDKFVAPVIEEFTKKTGIHVILHNAESTALLNKLLIEGEKTEADLFLSNDAGNLQIGSANALFRPIDTQILSVIDPLFYSETGEWVGLSGRARVIVVNTTSPAAGQITSVLDLARPEFKGKLGITHSKNESFIAGVTVYMASAGKEKTLEWLQGLDENAAGEVYSKHSMIVSDVAAGSKEVGLVNHYYIFRHLAKFPDAPIKMIMPDQKQDQMGVAFNVAGIAISRYSKHVSEASRFIEFLVSDEGQKIFADQNMEYPVRDDVAMATEVAAVGRPKIADIAMARLGQDRNATIELIESSGIP